MVHVRGFPEINLYNGSMIYI
jgi:hypothetical protein